MLNAERKKELKVFAEEIRLETLRVVHSRGFGHVGGSMSLCEAYAVLYGEIANVDPKNPRWEDRDWIVLSKGHAGPVMYATLGLKGYYPISDAYTLNHPGTNFPSHTDMTKTKGVDLTTGSLAQGMSEAIGAALGNKIDGRKSNTYVFVGDGECDEGEIWEGVQFSAHHKLDNLVCFIDDNKYQLDGCVCDIMTHGKKLGEKFEVFGWDVQYINGHDIEALYNAMTKAREAKNGKPQAIVLDTIKGLGATFAEESRAHSSQPSEEEWKVALEAAEKRLEDAKKA